MDRSLPHEELARGVRPRCPPTTRSTSRRQGFEHAEPGTVLRSRDVELAFLGLIPQKFTATQLLYRTTDMNGEPAGHRHDRDRARRTRPRAGLPDAVLPVRNRRRDITLLPVLRTAPMVARPPGALAQFEFLLISAALAEGWAVSVPDHEGPNGAWGTPYEPGYRDARRAARRARLGKTRPGGRPRRSGCGATPAVAWPPRGPPRCQADYAPELNVVGAVLGSPVGDLGHTFRRLNGSFFSGLPAMVVAALSHVYPDFDRVISEHATDEGKAMLHRVERMTTAPCGAASDRARTWASSSTGR